MPAWTTICITGGSGFFGRAMTRHLLRTYPEATIRCLSRNEGLRIEATQALGDPERVRWLTGDVRDENRLREALEGVDFLIHAAALKHVPICERDPNEALLTNVIGSMHVARAARRCGVKQAVFLSSDKAVAPTTVYGASKQLAEKAWIQQNAYSPYGTRYCAVRYGNVAGSRGSVLEVFARQVQNGGSLPVTDPSATRFWMHIDEAVALVTEVAHLQLRGAVAVPHLPAFALADLLQAMEAVFRKHLPWHLTGLRPAEKRHEVLMLPEEIAGATWYAPATRPPVFYVIPAAYPTWEAPGWVEEPQDGLVGNSVRGDGPLYTHYDSGTTPWRLSVEDLVAKLKYLMGEVNDPQH